VVVRRAAISARLRIADALDAVSGHGDPLVPPRRCLGFVGDSDFRQTGDEFLDHFRTLGGLTPGDRVLDIGSGIGRMARVLVPVLEPPAGSYDGFDVSRQGVEWCRAHYSGTAAPFRFTHVDLHHPEYNPSGTADAAQLRFPYADASFDLAIATSVFTHLLDGTVTRYLEEAARVLAPGGRLFSTWLLIDPRRPPEPSAPVFHPIAGAAAVADPSAPGAAVAYPHDWVTARLEDVGLTPREPYERGSWTGRPGTSSQDLLVADRPS
jgi:SAM-dependent methyltransferase